MKPEDISSQAEALILLAPPTQIFNQIEKLATGMHQRNDRLPKNNTLWFYEDRGIEFRGGKIITNVKDAYGAEIYDKNQYITGLYRGMLYCEYLTSEDITSGDAQTTFDTRYVCNQNIGTQNISLYGNPYFDAGMSAPTILYTVPAVSNNGVEARPDGKYLNKVLAWYYCPTQHLSIRANDATFTKMIGVAF